MGVLRQTTSLRAGNCCAADVCGWRGGGDRCNGVFRGRQAKRKIQKKRVGQKKKKSGRDKAGKKLVRVRKQKKDRKKQKR